MNARGENPFCANRIRPGAMPFLFPKEVDATILLDRLKAAGWQGQIVGPHGSGKSSLVSAILPALGEMGRGVRLVTLHDGQRHMAAGFFAPPVPPCGDLILVDGYEQLSRFERFRLRRFCNRHKLGLLVTSHRCAGLPDIFRPSPTPEAARQIVTELQRGYVAYVTAEDIAETYARREGNLREILFDLYDIYRERKISAASAGNSY